MSQQIQHLRNSPDSEFEDPHSTDTPKPRASYEVSETWNVLQKEDEHRALSNADTKYDVLTQISAIKTTQNEFKWHIDNTIFWKLPDVTQFRSLFYGPVHACRSAQRAINNIYSSLGVPATGNPLRHKYAKHAFYDKWTQIYRVVQKSDTPVLILR